MSEATKKQISRRVMRFLLEAVSIAFVIAVIFVVLRKWAPGLIETVETGDVNQVEDYIRHQGAMGKSILVLIQVVETISIVLPAVPVFIAAGALFGKLHGFLLCYITNLVMNYIIFTIARKFRIRTDDFDEAARNPRIEKLMTVSDRPVLFVILLSLIPVIPNGTIPYVSAQTGMDEKEYMKGLAIGSMPTILFYACFGDILLNFSFRSILPFLIVIIVAVVAIVVFRKQILALFEKLNEKRLAK
ncbi:MAG: VTT domain-containing protein [Solobacterium sp.]|nr:VTT domain-containing protein [Solobacterium sp.]